MPVLYFLLTLLLHLSVLVVPLFFDLMVVPGYAALFIGASLITTLLAPKISGLKRWHLLAFLPVLFVSERLLLLVLGSIEALPSTVLHTKEFVRGVADTGVINSIGVYFASSLIAIVALILQERRKILYIHRIVDTEDEWNRVFAWMRENNATGDINEFRWRLMQNRCFGFIATLADRILGSALLVPGKPETVYLSDFVFTDHEIGLELLSALLGRPEILKARRIHFISRLDQIREEDQLIEHWLRELYPPERFALVDGEAMQALRDFSPDGSALRPFAAARPLFTFSPDPIG